MTAEQRLKELGLTLPTVGAPWGSYVHAKRVGDLLYLSGKQPPDTGGKTPRGKLGAQMSVEDGYRHARGVGLMLIEESYVDASRPELAELATRGYLPLACEGCAPVSFDSWWGSGSMLDWSTLP